MKQFALILVCAGLLPLHLAEKAVDAAAPQRAAAGAIIGHVRVAGPSPANPIIRMGMDPKCAQLNRGARPVQEIVVRTAEGALANAFVDLEGTFAQTPVPATPVVLDQRNCVYAPRVIGARVGQVLRVVNHDALLHNVHSGSATNAFNFSQPSSGMTRDIPLKGPDVLLRIACDVHSWMVAWVGVESHPYFAVSGRDGSFRIDNVPAGRHTIRVWHERFGRLTKAVTVKAGAPTTLDFSFSGKEAPLRVPVRQLTLPGGEGGNLQVRVARTR